MRGMLMADFNRTAEAVASYREGGRAQARLQQGALGVVHGGAADPLRRRGARSPTQRAEYERRLRALRAAYEAGRIPATCRRASAWRSRSSSPIRATTTATCRRLFGGLAARIMADRYGDGRARAAAGAGRTDPRRHRQRLLLSAFGLEDRRQGLGHAARPEALPGVRLSHRHQAGCRDGVRPGALPQVRAGAELDRALAADHPRRPAARPDLSGNRHEPRRRPNSPRCASRRCNAATSAIRRPAAFRPSTISSAAN